MTISLKISKIWSSWVRCRSFSTAEHTERLRSRWCFWLGCRQGIHTVRHAAMFCPRWRRTFWHGCCQKVHAMREVSCMLRWRRRHLWWILRWLGRIVLWHDYRLIRWKLRYLLRRRFCRQSYVVCVPHKIGNALRRRVFRHNWGNNPVRRRYCFRLNLRHWKTRHCKKTPSTTQNLSQNGYGNILNYIHYLYFK